MEGWPSGHRRRLVEPRVQHRYCSHKSSYSSVIHAPNIFSGNSRPHGVHVVRHVLIGKNNVFGRFTRKERSAISVCVMLYVQQQYVYTTYS